MNHKLYFVMVEDKRYGDGWVRVDCWLVSGHDQPTNIKLHDMHIYCVYTTDSYRKACAAWGENQPDIYNDR